MKLNKNFAKPQLKADGTPDYAPSILKVATHHHDEWDEPVYDPDTGEPVIDPETVEQVIEHKTRDWDTWENKLWPTAEDYRKMGYLRVVDERPADEPPKGFHYVPTEKYRIEDSLIKRIYISLPNPQPPPRTFSKMKCVAALTESGVWTHVKGYLESEGLYDIYLAAQEFKEDNPYFTTALSELKDVLGWDDSKVEEILSKSTIY